MVFTSPPSWPVGIRTQSYTSRRHLNICSCMQPLDKPYHKDLSEILTHDKFNENTSNRLPCFILSVKNRHSDTVKFEGLAYIIYIGWSYNKTISWTKYTTGIQILGALKFWTKMCLWSPIFEWNLNTRMVFDDSNFLDAIRSKFWSSILDHGFTTKCLTIWQTFNFRI